MSERALLASINGEPIGTLQDVNGIWANKVNGLQEKSCSPFCFYIDM